VTDVGRKERFLDILAGDLGAAGNFASHCYHGVVCRESKTR
jgi:hypothetical protein